MFRPKLEALEPRLNPGGVYSYTIPGQPTSVGFTHAQLGEFGNEGAFIPFADYAGPLNTAMHARDTIVVGAGESGAPRVQVRAVRAADAGVVADFFAYEESFRGGVRVAVGDVDGDRIPDLITGAAAGGGPRVSVFSGASSYQIRTHDFFAYSDEFRGGVWVGFADPDGDGTGVLVTAPGQGGGPHVKTYDLTTNTITNRFYGDPANRSVRQWVVGDLDGDELVEIGALDGNTVAVYDLASGVQVYRQAVPPDTVIGAGGWFDYFGSSLMSAPFAGQPGMYEYHLPLGVARHSAIDFLGVPVRPGNYAFGTLLHPSLQARSRDVFPDQSSLDLRILPVGEIDILPAPDFGTPRSQTRIRPLAGSTSVGSRFTGTLGGFVTDPQGRLYGLTNEHVLAQLGGQPYSVRGVPVTQPGRADDGVLPADRVGVTGRVGGIDFGPPGVANPVDAGLVELDPGVPVSPGVVVYQDLFGNVFSLRVSGTREARVGDLIHHIGRTTGIARHIVVGTGETVPVGYQDGLRATLTGQMVAHGIYGGSAANGGDSGSAVLVYDKFAARWFQTGLLFAGGSAAMVFNPIAAVESALGVTVATA